MSIDRKDAPGLNLGIQYLGADKKRRNQQERLRKTDIEGKPEEWEVKSTEYFIEGMINRIKLF